MLRRAIVIFLCLAPVSFGVSTVSQRGNVMLVERPVKMIWPFSMLRHRYVVVNNSFILTSGPGDGPFWNAHNIAYLAKYKPESNERVVATFNANLTESLLTNIVTAWNASLKRYTISNNCYDFAAWSVKVITKGQHESFVCR